MPKKNRSALPKPFDMTTGWLQGDCPLIQDSEPG
jgi:hypothetical protein